MKYALVTTTINIPLAIGEYVENARRWGVQDMVIVVVGDRKSPAGTAAFLKNLQSAYPIEYLDVQRQQDYLAYAPLLRDFLPFDSVQRRNVGYLFAAKEYGAQTIITVDDDNFPLDGVNFFEAHGVVGSTVTATQAGAANGWLNSCWLLESTPPRTYYHRGYPVSKRDLSHDIVLQQNAQRRVMINVGLWLRDPDVDTISRLDGQSVVSGIKTQDSYLVAHGCLCPFNSQNTAFSAELLPSMYLPAIPASVKTTILKGNNNFRYDDIWMSFFAKLCLDAVGGGLLLGGPLVEQRRNVHDLFLDMEKELIPMRLTDMLADAFTAMRPSGKNILDCYSQITDGLELLARQFTGLHEEERQLLLHFITGMRLWADAVDKR